MHAVAQEPWDRRLARSAASSAAAPAPTRAARASSRTRRAASARSFGRHSRDDQVPLAAPGEQLEVDSLGHDVVLPGKAHGRGRRGLLARRDESRRCVRAGGHAAPSPAGSRAAPPKGTRRRSVPARRGVPGTRATAARARTRGRRRSVPERARATGSRARRPERRCGFGARSALPGREPRPPRRARPARLAVRRRDRVHGSTMRGRSPSDPGHAEPAATPATCSFTSCGCDQAKGVTRQMRRPTLRV